jgi:hypothetical protein
VSSYCLLYLLSPYSLPPSYVQELEARLLYMEQLFKQHAPDVEVFPKEGSGLPPQMAKNVPVLNPFPSATRPSDSDGRLDDDLDVLGQVKHEDESNITDHFGQMAIDAEGHHQCVLQILFVPVHARVRFTHTCPSTVGLVVLPP